jgi:ketosteroid isomerase-like protein
MPVWPLALSLALTLGCKRQADESTQATASLPAPSHATAAAGTSVAAVMTAPSTASAPASGPSASTSGQGIAAVGEVKDFIVQWQNAQNGGNLAAYEVLYASKFTGIKRAGPRTTRFDRGRWLQDRKSMFNGPFSVQLDALQVHPSTDVVLVNFQQTWKSAKFQDVGQKQLLLVREGGNLRIAKEEMLTSAAGEARRLEAISFESAAIAHGLPQSLVLLHPIAVDLNWLTEHPRYISNELAERAVAAAALPATLRALAILRYEIFDASGQSCVSSPIGFKVLAEAIPHFGTVMRWEDSFASSEGRRPNVVPNAERALDVWNLASISPERGLRFGIEFPSDERCPRPVWGRVLKEGAPKPWKVREPSAEESRQIQAEVLEHPMLSEFTVHGRRLGVLGPTDVWYSAHRARVIESESGAVSYHARVDGHSDCAGPPSSEGLAWRKQGDRLRVTRSPQSLGIPAAAVDLDGDGSAELIAGGTGILTWGDEGYEWILEYVTLSYDCGC